MAPIETSTGNSPAVVHAPEAAPDGISWRSMAVNWAGSMLFIGFCAPLMVWLTVYCIRTRRKRERPIGKLGTAITTAKESTQRSKGRHDANATAKKTAKQSTGGERGIETYDLMPLDPGPPARDKDNNKIPKTTHLSRYLGWWSSGTSREEVYPPDPRARKKGAGPYTKRQHFTRFFGWCTSSEQEGNRVPRRHSDPGPVTRAGEKQISVITSLPRRASEEANTSGIPRSAVTPQRWQLGHHVKAKAIDNLSQALHASTTGVDFTWPERSSQNSIQSRAQGELLMDGLLGTDETSEHRTVRRRAVGIAEACDWANLSNELRRSVHTQALLPHRGDDIAPTVKLVEPTDVTPTHDLLLASGETSAKSLEKAVLPVFTPKLRKVRSSPTLHTAYKDLDASLGRPSSSPVYDSLSSNSSPGRLIPHHDQMDGVGAEMTGDLSRCPTGTGAIISAASSAQMSANNMGKSSLTFSFDKTRRSTLDVVRIPLEFDRQTLEEYEAECSVDAGFSTRAGSESTLSSFEEQPLDVHHKNEDSPRIPNPEISYQAQSEIDCQRSLYNFGRTLESTSNETRVPTPNNGIDLSSPIWTANLFAVPTIPKRRYSFPGPGAGKHVTSENDRKFAFHISNYKEEKIRPTRSKRHTMSRHECKIPVMDLGSRIGLVVSKTRASETGKSDDMGTSRPRKLTPFVNGGNSPWSRSSPRKSLPRDWQMMNRLSEATSSHSENEVPINRRSGTMSLYSRSTSIRSEKESVDISHSSNHSKTHEVVTWPTCPSYPSTPTIPRPLSAMPLRVIPEQDAQQKPASMPSNLQDSIGFLPSVYSSNSETVSSAVAVLTETQLSSGGSSVKHAFRNPSSAEMAKRNETMRRAGRIICDRDDLRVTLCTEFENGESGPGRRKEAAVLV